MIHIRVLLADDRDAERADIAGCLNRDPRFHADDCALSREEIERAIEAGTYDLLLLDVEWRPEVNRKSDAVDQTFGLKLLEDLHVLLDTSGIKVVLLTIHDVLVPGSLVGAKIRELLDRGYAHGYLRKPFIPSHHIAVLAKIAESSENQEDL